MSKFSFSWHICFFEWKPTDHVHWFSTLRLKILILNECSLGYLVWYWNNLQSYCSQEDNCQSFLRHFKCFRKVRPTFLSLWSELHKPERAGSERRIQSAESWTQKLKNNKAKFYLLNINCFKSCSAYFKSYITCLKICPITRQTSVNKVLNEWMKDWNLFPRYNFTWVNF